MPVSDPNVRLAVLLAALLALLGCGDRAPPPAEAPSVLGIELPRDAYPTLEPFASSAFWKMFGGTKSPGALAKELATMPTQLRLGRARVDKAAGAERVWNRPAAPGELAPRLDGPERPTWMFVPMLIRALEPQWGRGDWSADETALAKAVGEVLTSELGATGLAYRGGSPKANQAWMRRVVAWFRAQVARAECYAAMMMTFDDGPYIGADVELAKDAEPVAHVDLADGLRIEGHTIESDGTTAYALRAARGSEPLWTRLLTNKDGRRYEIVDFGRIWAEAPGPYGSRVHFRAQREHAHLHVAPDGRFLFYYVSW